MSEKKLGKKKSRSSESPDMSVNIEVYNTAVTKIKTAGNFPELIEAYGALALAERHALVSKSLDFQFRGNKPKVGKKATSALVNNARLFSGTTVGEVAAHLISYIRMVRTNKDLDGFVSSLCVAIITSMAVSRQTHELYTALGTKNMWSVFEISGKRESNTENSSWVTGCKMNAGALRIAGHLIIEAASEGGSDYAKMLIKSKGTIFHPADSGTEFVKFCKSAHDELPRGTREVLDEVCQEYKILAAIIMDNLDVAATGGKIGHLITEAGY